MGGEGNLLWNPCTHHHSQDTLGHPYPNWLALHLSHHSQTPHLSSRPVGAPPKVLGTSRVCLAYDASMEEHKCLNERFDNGWFLFFFDRESVLNLLKLKLRHTVLISLIQVRGQIFHFSYHPERPERINKIWSALVQYGLTGRTTLIKVIYFLGCFEI